MALGNILRSAREEMGLSSTDVAEQTNMMVQIVNELENEDFHRIAAPIYGRGFLKLYAELLEIEAQPLIEEFMDIYTGKIDPELRKLDLNKSEVQETPVPNSELEQDVQESVVDIPQRVDVIPNQSVKNLEITPKLPTKTKISELPLVSEPPVVEVEPQPEVVAVAQDTASELEPQSTEVVEEQVVPEEGEGLFDSEEPNLFNTTPLQERVAEARRLMDEKSDVGNDQDKRSKLHLGSNQKLPIFQINGRMDQTYDTEPKGVRARSKKRILLDSFLSGINRFFDRLCDRLPFDVSKKSFYVYGLLGLIVIAFLSAGIFVLFKLTAPAENSGGEEVVIVEKKLEHKNSVFKDKVPSPPDMYFD